MTININKQINRGFVFIPALGWHEIPQALMSVVIEKRFPHFWENQTCDQHTNAIHSDGKLVAIYTIFKGNANRKDTNHVKRWLADTYNRCVNN